MKKSLGSKKIYQHSRREASPNPMDGVANMADVMLVLAVGIMLALIINWNVSLKPSGEGTGNSASQQLPIEDSQTDYIEPQDEGQQVGTVYRRADGSLYYIMDEGQ